MFNYRLDKIGFFATLILATVFTATLVATGVLLLLGLILGDWDTFGFWVKVTIGVGWVLCVVTVLVRVYAYHYRRQKMFRELEQQAASMQSTQLPGEQAANGQDERNGPTPHSSVEKQQSSGEQA